MTNISRLRGLLAMGVSTIAVASVAAPAIAQDAVLEELVITAEKREQSLQDVPVAISAFTSKSRDLVGINTIQDLTNFTPGFVYQSANDQASMRGIGRLTNAIGTDPSVAAYSDGIFSNSMFDATTPSIFIERTEVLRGPQGTL